jgi:hypothetical protein
MQFQQLIFTILLIFKKFYTVYVKSNVYNLSKLFTLSPPKHNYSLCRLNNNM